MACGKWMGYDCLGTAVMNVCKTQMPCENVNRYNYSLSDTAQL